MECTLIQLLTMEVEALGRVIAYTTSFMYEAKLPSS